MTHPNDRAELDRAQAIIAPLLPEQLSLRIVVLAAVTEHLLTHWRGDFQGLLDDIDANGLQYGRPIKEVHTGAECMPYMTRILTGLCSADNLRLNIAIAALIAMAWGLCDAEQICIRVFTNAIRQIRIQYTMQETANSPLSTAAIPPINAPHTRGTN